MYIIGSPLLDICDVMSMLRMMLQISWRLASPLGKWVVTSVVLDNGLILTKIHILYLVTVIRLNLIPKLASFFAYFFTLRASPHSSKMAGFIAY